jgi:hypothetical protein
MCKAITRFTALACLLFPLFSSLSGQSMTFDWAADWGSTSVENANNMAIAPDGSIFTVGGFAGLTDFDPGPGTFNLNSAYSSSYLLKLDANGNFLWVKQFSGSMVVGAHSVNVDPFGNIILSGGYQGDADLDPGPATYILPDLGDLCGFVCKLSPQGDFIWARGFYGPQQMIAYKTAIDAQGAVYASGYFKGGVDFDPGTGIDSLYSAGLADAFVLKLDSAGDYQWAKRFGSSESESSGALFLDGMGDLYFSGTYHLQVDFDPGPGIAMLSAVGAADVFMLKMDPDGNLIDAQSVGGPLDDIGAIKDVQADGRLVLAGYFQGTIDLDPTAAVNTLTANTTDGFVAIYSSMGTLTRANQFAGTGTVRVDDAFEDSYGNLHVFGYLLGDVDADPGSAVHTLSGNPNTSDGFYAVLDSTGALQWASNTGGSGNDWFSNAEISPQGKITVFASYTGTTDLDLTSGTRQANCRGISDCALFQMHFCSPTTGNATVNGCGSYTIGGQTFSTSGTYSVSLTSAFGCDSLLTLNLFLDSMNLAIASQNDTLVLQDTSFVAYQWLDCDQGMAPIPGATQHWFAPTDSGNFAVIATLGSGCSDTSVCASVSFPATLLRVGPNPVSDGSITLDLRGMPAGDYSFRIVDSMGNTCHQDLAQGGTRKTIDISAFPNGLFWVNTGTKDQRWVSKFVVLHHH